MSSFKTTLPTGYVESGNIWLSVSGQMQLYNGDVGTLCTAWGAVMRPSGSWEAHVFVKLPEY